MFGKATPTADEYEEMRRAGQQDAECLFEMMYDPSRPSRTTEGAACFSHVGLHAFVASMSQFIPHPEPWKEGFWGWWERNGPK